MSSGFNIESIHFVNIDECKEETQEDEVEPKVQSSGLESQANPVEEMHSFVVKEPVDTLNGKVKSISSSKFRIPELPTGQHLVINILSTWYVDCPSAVPMSYSFCSLSL